jgi:hypothetical protein
MKLEALVFGLFATIQALGAVLYFSPVPGSFWGDTFFEIPYPLAIWAVPISCGSLAVLVSYWFLRNDRWRKRRVRLGLTVATFSFLAYAMLHVLLASFAGGFGVVSLLPAMILFGGIFFLPVSLVLSVIASFLGSWLSAHVRSSA